MRRSNILFLLSASVFGSALAMPQQQGPVLAEQQFKNIKSLKGLKASEVIPAMEFMSASMKVDCKFCHVPDDWASDANEHKRTTRSMIEMQNDINEKNFGGQPEVTCATCHGGRAHPINFSHAEGAELRARQSAAVVPADVLAAYAKAVGPNPTPVVAGLRLQGTSSNRGATGKVEALYAGERFRMTTHLAKGQDRMGFNGKEPWVTMDNAVVAFPLEHAHQFLNERKIFFGPQTLPKMDRTSGGTAKIGGRDQNVLSGYVQGDDKTRVSLFFDKETGLLSRATYTYITVLGNIAQVNDYSNYQKVNGISVPMTVGIHAADKDQVLQFATARIETNPDSKVFDPPK